MANDNRPLALQRDPYGERIKVMKFDWRDEQVVAWIQKFIEFGQKDSRGNIERQRAKRSGALLRSVYWRTWSSAGGDMQVFEARYLYYAKFVELALGKSMPFIGLPPGIQMRKWQPIPMPDGRPRKAKPSIATEMRKQARKFVTMLEDEFLYHGISMLVYPLSTSISNQALIDRLIFQKRAFRASQFA